MQAILHGIMEGDQIIRIISYYGEKNSKYEKKYNDLSASSL